MSRANRQPLKRINRGASIIHNSIASSPRYPFTSASTREGAAGQAVVCPLLRGSSPTRGVAPKQHRVAPRLALLSAIHAREGAIEFAAALTEVVSLRRARG